MKYSFDKRKKGGSQKNKKEREIKPIVSIETCTCSMHFIWYSSCIRMIAVIINLQIDNFQAFYDYVNIYHLESLLRG